MKHKTLACTLSAGAFLLASAFSTAVPAVTITALNGQTPEQIQIDRTECAKQVPAAAPARGGAARGAAAGAMAGAAGAQARGNQHGAYDYASDNAKQNYRQNQAKDTAKAGAAVGLAKQGKQNRNAKNQDPESTPEFANCLSPRGYSVQ